MLFNNDAAARDDVLLRFDICFQDRPDTADEVTNIGAAAFAAHAGPVSRPGPYRRFLVTLICFTMVDTSNQSFSSRKRIFTPASAHELERAIVGPLLDYPERHER
ncbi:MAG: hypothetical protein E4G96_04720 [Chrysiogenales bacterium]|nr:MAG: hypothetical protein E4G96_04720 [Chrysiogenales bacterium]